MTKHHFSTKIPETLSGKRLDQALAELFPDYSRSRLQQWLKDGFVRVNGVVITRPRTPVNGAETVDIDAPASVETAWQGQQMPLNIVYEDADILVIDKPAGLTVHPGAGNPDSTLVNALLHYAPELAELPRAGIIHRLDKDTSGILVVARSLAAHAHLVEALQARRFAREYEAVVVGQLTGGGVVDAPIGRHPRQRTRMAVVDSGKPAMTHYRVITRFRAHTHVAVRLETGRTHQIRVHMAYRGYPLVGDPVYGGRLKLPPNCAETLREALRGFKRQALHAVHLGLEHPRSGAWLDWDSPLAQDLRGLLAVLQADKERE
jgi:23S rRNA pseudouridine1911/1915/1917 synthase